MNMRKLFQIIALCMFAFSAYSAVPVSNLVINCRTDKHTIQIDKFQESYRYKSWNLPKSLLEKPDMEVSNGTLEVEGTGACSSQIWTFTKGAVKFVMDNGIACLEKAPPVGTVANLVVLIKGEEKTRLFCKKY